MFYDSKYVFISYSPILPYFQRKIKLFSRGPSRLSAAKTEPRKSGFDQNAARQAR